MFVLIIIGAILLIALGYYAYKKIKAYRESHLIGVLERKERKNKGKHKDKHKEVANFKNDALVVNSNFLTRKELIFWKYICSILPNGFVCFPKVALCSLVSPNGDRVMFNLIAEKTLDFVIIHEQTLKPVLVIDIYNKSYADERLEAQDANVTNALENLKIKFISILVDVDFDKEKTKQEIFKLLEN